MSKSITDRAFADALGRAKSDPALQEPYPFPPCSDAPAKRRPGRPSLDLSPAEKERRKRESRAKSNAKVRNVTLDADIIDELGKVEDRLEEELGFRPTHSQAIRWMIRHSMRNL